MKSMTLTEVSYYARRLAPYVLLGVLVILIVFYAIKLLLVSLENRNANTIRLNPAFQQIKNPLDHIASSSAGITYKLDTIEGRPIIATSAAQVFFVVPPTATSFGYREKMYLIAKTMGIDVDAARYRLLGKNAIFAQDDQKLIIDIQNFNFSYQYFFENVPGFFLGVDTPTTEEGVSRAINFLQSIDLYPQALASGKTHTVFFSYDELGQAITPLPDERGANLVEVDFTRPDIDGLPIVSSTFFNSQNYALLAHLKNRTYRVLRAQVKHFDLSEEQVGVYPLRNGDEAYSDLRDGRGYIISNPSGARSVTVRKMFLAYYDREEYQDYLQPVFVFVGDDNFVAYVPAIAKSYLAN